MSCALKRFEDDGSRFEDRAIVELAVANGLYRFEAAIQGVIENFPNALLRPVLSLVIFPMAAAPSPPPTSLPLASCGLPSSPASFAIA